MVDSLGTGVSNHYANCLEKLWLRKNMNDSASQLAMLIDFAPILIQLSVALYDNYDLNYAED